MVRLEILDSTKLIERESGRAYALGSGGHLLAYLALHSPEAVDRRRCALDLYPDDEYEVSGNRIRVAVARFKKLLGDAIVASGTELRLEVSGMEVDFVEIQQRLKAIGDLVDVADELGELKSLAPMLGKKLLPEVHESWARTWQQEWQQNCLSWLNRTETLAKESGDWRTSAEALWLAIQHGRSEPETWRAYLRSMHQLDELERGLREMKSHSIAEHAELSKSELNDLLNYVEELKSGQFDVSNRWSDSQLMSLGRMLARAIEDAPGDAASFFMANGAVGEFYRDPSTYLPFLYELIADDSISGETEQEMRLRIIDAEGLRYNWREVIKQTDFLLAQDIVPHRKGRAFFSRSFAFFQARDFESAVSMIQQSAEIYEQLGDGVKAQNSRAVEASYWWHLGQYDKALSMYADARIALLAQNSPLSRSNTAISWANTATVNVVLGHWENAKRSMLECIAAMGNEPNENMLAMFNTVAGLVYVVDGDLEKGIDLLVDGLKRSYRRGSSREQQIGLEWAAGALSVQGLAAEALGILDWVDDWRNQTQHSRSVAEKQYADRVKADCGSVTAIKLDPDEDSKRVISFVINLLRKSEARRVVA